MITHVQILALKCENCGHGIRMHRTTRTGTTCDACDCPGWIDEFSRNGATQLPTQ